MAVTCGDCCLRKNFRDGRVGRGCESVAAVHPAAARRSVVVECADSAADTASERYVYFETIPGLQKNGTVVKKGSRRAGKLATQRAAAGYRHGFLSPRFRWKTMALSDERVALGCQRSDCEKPPFHLSRVAQEEAWAGIVHRAIVCVRGSGVRLWYPNQSWRRTGCHALLEIRMGVRVWEGCSPRGRVSASRVWVPRS